MFREIITLFKSLSLVKIQKSAFLQLALVILGQLALREAFYGSLVLLGQSNVTISNIKMLFTNPFGLSLFLLYGLLAIAILHVEFYLLFQIVKGEHLLKWSSPLDYAKKIWRLFGGWNLPVVILYLIITIPVLQLVLPTIVTQKLTIPNFITGELSKTLIGKIGLYSTYLVIFYLNLRLMFTIPYVVINNDNFLNGIKASWKISHKRMLTTAFSIIGVTVITTLGLVLLMLVLMLIVTELDAAGNRLVYQIPFLTLSWILIFLTNLVIKLLIADSLGRPLGMEKRQSQPSLSEKRRLAVLSILACLGTGFVASQRLHTLPSNHERLIIAHRGMVSGGVENSLEALEAAAKHGSDYVEMDIIMTADGEFVVSHDDNLKRLAGLNQTISDSTLNEVVGTKISQGNFTSHLVSFDTYVARAKELGVKLLVELKPTGKEPADYGQRFIDKFEKLGLVELGYKAMSLDVKLMEKINRIKPEIETGYVIPLQFGFFGEEKIDFYVIEDFSYRPTLAYQAAWLKKQVYVWTINDSERMEYFLRQAVDGIITDYPDQIRQVERDIREQTSLFDRVMQLLQENL